ncbi:MAG: hypothetical protein WDO56_21795 [Gammaproteobacteria bacterium]
MLGLPTAESGFADELLKRYRPHPAVVIFDASPYFTGSMGIFEEGIFRDQEKSRQSVLKLRDFQTTHEKLCSRLTWACGHNFSYFRSRLDGHWIFPRKRQWHLARQAQCSQRPRALPHVPRCLKSAVALSQVSRGGSGAGRQARYPEALRRDYGVPAETDLSALPPYLADALGITLISPVVPNLVTFDQAHLTPESSQRWDEGFPRRARTRAAKLHRA